MSDDEQLRSYAAEVEQMLEDIRGLVPAPAWQRIERLLGRVVHLYAAGLAHTLEHARRAGVTAPVFDELLAADDLLASLLVLHGLHPHSVDERVQRALVEVREQLGISEADLALVSLADGRVVLRAEHGLGGGAMAARVAEGVIRKVLEGAAPELKAVDITGVAPPRDPSLVKLRVNREAP